MKCSWKKSALPGLAICMAVLISGCATSGNGSVDESSGIKTEQATENTTENITESVTHEEKETKTEEPDIMSVTSWSEPYLSFFREVFYPGF